MRLFFGKIAPYEPQKEQLDGSKGWSWRYKVRIFDKHPEDKSVLPDEELPWAQVLLPVTAGSGAANYAQSPALNQGDTVSIAYFDDDEQMPIIFGILPRTDVVPTSEEDETDGFMPTTGFNEDRPKSSLIADDESNQSNRNSQPSTRSDRFSSVIGETSVLTNGCDPNVYKADAVAAEINNLINQIQKISKTAEQKESLINGAIDRVHALVNPYVGEMFKNVFESLIPVLNSGLEALYRAVYAKVYAATQNHLTATLAAQAALIALIPPIQILQEAIQLLAAQVVNGLLSKVEALVRDTVDNNDNFTVCASTQFNGAMINAIIGDIDTGLSPLLLAVATVLSGGFDTANVIRGTMDILRDFTGGLFGPNQGSNKCSGTISEYAFGFGPKSTIGDSLTSILESANLAESLVRAAKEGTVSDFIKDVDELTGTTSDGIQVIDSATKKVNKLTDDVDEFISTFGDFPFMSQRTGLISNLDRCSSKEPDTCQPPEVFIFGGRGKGAKAKAIVGKYKKSKDSRTVKDVQGGVIAIKVEDGGEGYIYPPFVEVKDECKLGIGCHARAVIRKGKVKRIYIVTPGEGYPGDGRDIFVPEEVELIEGGKGYTPGIVEDEYGNDYEIITDDIGTVIEIKPITAIPVDDIPTINIPTINPPIPPGGIKRPVEDPDDPDGPPKYIVEDRDGNVIRPILDRTPTDFAEIGSGLKFKVILTPLPTSKDILEGNFDVISQDLKDRLGKGIEKVFQDTEGDIELQDEIQQIIDCIES